VLLSFKGSGFILAQTGVESQDFIIKNYKKGLHFARTGSIMELREKKEREEEYAFF
jgi:hypothetical protein